MAESSKDTTYPDKEHRIRIIQTLYNQPNLMSCLYKAFLSMRLDRFPLNEGIINIMHSHISQTDPVRIRNIRNLGQYLEFKAFEENPHDFLGVDPTSQITLGLLDQLSNPNSEEEGAYLVCKKNGSLAYQKDLFKYKDNQRLVKAYISRDWLGILDIDILTPKIVTDAFETRRSEAAEITSSLEDAKTWLLTELEKASPVRKRK